MLSGIGTDRLAIQDRHDFVDLLCPFVNTGKVLLPLLLCFMQHFLQRSNEFLERNIPKKVGIVISPAKIFFTTKNSLLAVFNVHQNDLYLSSSFNISSPTCGLALPLVARINWPTKNFRDSILPFL